MRNNVNTRKMHFSRQKHVAARVRPLDQPGVPDGARGAGVPRVPGGREARRAAPRHADALRRASGDRRASSRDHWPPP